MNEAVAIYPERHVFAPIPAGARIPPLWAIPFVAVGLVLTGFLVLGVTGGLLMAGGVDLSGLVDDWRIISVAAVIALMLMVGVTVLWVVYFERRPLETVGFRRFRPGSDSGWFGLGVLFAMTTSSVMFFLGGAESPSFLSLFALVLDDPLRLLAIAVVLALVLLPNSIIEELIFRGWALSAIARRAGIWWAVGLTSAAFGMVHVPPTEWANPARLLSFVSYSAVGVAFAALALRRGSLYAPIAFHTGFNALLLGDALASLNFQPQELAQTLTNSPLGTEDLTEAVVWLLVNLAFAAGLVWWWRRSRPEPTPASAFE